MINIINITSLVQNENKDDLHIGGHPFMTSTPRGRGQAQMDACGRGERGQVPCGRPHRKFLN